MSLTTEDHEILFDAIAQAIDRAGAAQAPLMLAKLALLLAQRLGDRAAVEQALAQAQMHLEHP